MVGALAVVAAVLDGVADGGGIPGRESVIFLAAGDGAYKL